MRAQIRIGLITLALLWGFCVGADEPALLTKSDVHKIMQQIFDQHVDQKKISSKLIRKSLKVYIDQFDPDRTYLLESEVKPFLNPSASGLDVFLQEYDKNNFEIYEKLNLVIQNAISRARLSRIQLFDDSKQLFADSQNAKIDPNADIEEGESKIPFASSEEDLLKRQRNQILTFLAQEREHYGNSEVNRNPKATLGVLDSKLILHENEYLFQDRTGKVLSPEQKDNIFVLHILKSLAGSLDAHTTVFNPAEAYDMKVRLEKGFQGIGVILKQGSQGEVRIASFVKGGPAEVSKQLELNDQIVAIEGKNITKEPFQNVMEMLKGKNSSAVTITVKRALVENGQSADKEFIVTLQRAPITLNEDRVETDYADYGSGIIGKITLNSFYQGDGTVNSENDIKEAIKSLSKKGNLRGLILDLRENNGGFLSQAVKVAGLFISNGVVVVSKYSSGEERFYRDMDGKITYNGPLIILTSRATASAAEIVAQALQDYGVALIVGDEQTYGKGTIQSQTVTENNATNYFKVTVGKYYTVSGKTPQIQGVKADIIVPSPFNKEHIGEEYLEGSLKADEIASSFDDSLGDVQPGLKPWYIRYYTPTLQHQTDKWRKLVPYLSKKSRTRTESDAGFQDYEKWIVEVAKPRKNGEKIVVGSNFDSKKDYQMTEAFNIMKDMVDEDAATRYLGGEPSRK